MTLTFEWFDSKLEHVADLPGGERILILYTDGSHALVHLHFASIEQSFPTSVGPEENMLIFYSTTPSVSWKNFKDFPNSYARCAFRFDHAARRKCSSRPRYFFYLFEVMAVSLRNPLPSFTFEYEHSTCIPCFTAETSVFNTVEECVLAVVAVVAVVLNVIWYIMNFTLLDFGHAGHEPLDCYPEKRAQIFSGLQTRNLMLCEMHNLI